MTTTEAVRDLINTAFRQFGGRGDAKAVVLRRRKGNAVSKKFGSRNPDLHCYKERVNRI